MSNYDAGEDFAAGDELDRLDWSDLRRVRQAIASIADPRERREAALELLRAVYGADLELR